MRSIRHLTGPSALIAALLLSLGCGGQQSGPPPGEMVLIPAGEFTMGSDKGERDERPAHKVHVDAFYLDKYEATNADYAAFLNAGNNDHGYPQLAITQSGNTFTPVAGKENLPVANVSWLDAYDYCKWAGKRLPTEAEWEKAARGTDERTYPWGAEMDAHRANCRDSGDPFEPGVTPVGYYNGQAYDGFQTLDSPGPCGAYDLCGNVWEWCADWYDEDYYTTTPNRNPKGPAKGTYRVLRGGSWFTETENGRTTTRLRRVPTFRHASVGIRCARNP